MAECAPSGLSGSSTLVGVEHPRLQMVASSQGCCAGRQALRLWGGLQQLLLSPMNMEVKVFSDIRLGFDGRKEGWCQGGTNSLGFHAAYIHLYHGGVSGSFTQSSHVPEQQLLKVKYQSFNPHVQSSRADHPIPAL